MSSELSILKKTLAKYSGQPESSQATQNFSPKLLDVVFIFDTTGSMYGYLEKVRQELTRLASEIHKSVPNARMGVIAYGDYDTSSIYVTKVLDLTPDFDKVQSFVQQVERTGGGGPPEAVEEALFEANRLGWRIGSSRAIVLVGDAPPHGIVDSAPKRDYKAEGKALGQKGIKIYATQCGKDSSAEQAFCWLAKQTNGTYLNLENIADLVDLLIGVCMKEVGLLESYTKQLESKKELTGSKAQIFKQLKGS